MVPRSIAIWGVKSAKVAPVQWSVTGKQQAVE
jgi:hypothetical protein